MGDFEKILSLQTYSDSQQEVISDYFIKRGFKVEWRFDDERVISWV